MIEKCRNQETAENVNFTLDLAEPPVTFLLLQKWELQGIPLQGMLSHVNIPQVALLTLWIHVYFHFIKALLLLQSAGVVLEAGLGSAAGKRNTFSYFSENQLKCTWLWWKIVVSIEIKVGLNNIFLKICNCSSLEDLLRPGAFTQSEQTPRLPHASTLSSLFGLGSAGSGVRWVFNRIHLVIIKPFNFKLFPAVHYVQRCKSLDFLERGKLLLRCSATGAGMNNIFVY